MSRLLRSSVTTPLILVILATGCSKSPDAEALARCENAGDAYSASVEAVENTKAEYEAIRETLMATKESERNVEGLSVQLEDVRRELQRAKDELEYVDDVVAAVSRAADRAEVYDRDNGPDSDPRQRRDAIIAGTRSYTRIPEEELDEKLDTPLFRTAFEAALHAVQSHYAELGHRTYAREFHVATPAAESAIDIDAYRSRVDASSQEEEEIQSRISEIYTQIVLEVNDQTAGLRQRIQELTQRVRLDEELAKSSVREANRLREPGGVVCSWQFQ